MTHANRSSSGQLVLKVLNLIAFVGVLVVNYLATALPINDRSTGELADMYPNLFVPTGLTFSIWGVIYILLAAFCIHQLTRDSRVRERIGWLFLLTCATNIGWIFAWHYLLVGLSVVIMLIFFAALLAIYLRLGIALPGASRNEKLFGYLPFGVYFGWISVALIANVTALLVHVGWGGFGVSEATWAIIMIAIGAAVGIFVVLARNDMFFGLVIVWAYAGIVIKRLSVEPVVQSVAIAAGICGLAVLVLAAVRARRWITA